MLELSINTACLRYGYMFTGIKYMLQRLWKTYGFIVFTERALSPQGSVHSVKEEDSISIYSNDSLLEEGNTETSNPAESKDIADGIHGNKVVFKLLHKTDWYYHVCKFIHAYGFYLNILSMILLLIPVRYF